jgi:hypothetical protein
MDVKHIYKNLIYFFFNASPLEEEGHIAWHLSVGMLVDQMMSAQYLANLSLDCYDILYVGW